jgi:ABC-type dipeptide/oligopeptide/nickel transport system permease component
MVMKFKNVEKLDNSLNRQLLNCYRDSNCTTSDIYNTFKIINEYKRRNDPRWRQYYNYLKKKIVRLRQRGCNVSKLEKVFVECEKKSHSLEWLYT